MPETLEPGTWPSPLPEGHHRAGWGLSCPLALGGFVCTTFLHCPGNAFQRSRIQGAVCGPVPASRWPGNLKGAEWTPETLPRPQRYCPAPTAPALTLLSPLGRLSSQGALTPQRCAPEVESSNATHALVQPGGTSVRRPVLWGLCRHVCVRRPCSAPPLPFDSSVHSPPVNINFCRRLSPLILRDILTVARPARPLSP